MPLSVLSSMLLFVCGVDVAVVLLSVSRDCGCGVVTAVLAVVVGGCVD